MQFLYPTSRQFPFDEVCERIVHELEQRNWQVPGITVDFHDYKGENGFRTVSKIKSQDFKLWFCRRQPGGFWYDLTGVTDIVIPKKKLSVYEDESGPTFYLYDGDDYEQDRDWFMNGLEFSKPNNGPRLYRKYSGECRCKSIQATSPYPDIPHMHEGRRSPLLANNKYPKFFCTDKVMAEFKKYLEEVVLEMIISHSRPCNHSDQRV